MVAPSTVTINFTDGKSVHEEPPIDCRVRFLSFLGIGRNDQKCAFIMHTAQDTFVAYAFHCEGSAGPLCKVYYPKIVLRSFSTIIFSSLSIQCLDPSIAFVF